MQGGAGRRTGLSARRARRTKSRGYSRPTQTMADQSILKSAVLPASPMPLYCSGNLTTCTQHHNMSDQAIQTTSETHLCNCCQKVQKSASQFQSYLRNTTQQFLKPCTQLVILMFADNWRHLRREKPQKGVP